MHRVDNNHTEIVDALRSIGATVLDLASVGKGAPDLLVGYRGNDTLLEIKSEGGKLQPNQAEWHQLWRGSQVRVVRSVAEAFKAIKAEVVF